MTKTQTPNFDMGGQLMRAWTETMDAWWASMLGDPARLSQLAERMGGTPGAGEVSREDLAAVLQALELVEKRLDDMDDKVRILAESMSQLVEVVQAGEQGRGEA